MSSVHGPGPTRAGKAAFSRSLIRALTIVAMLLLAAFAAAPAYAQDQGGNAPGASTPPGSSDQTPPASTPPADTTPTPPPTTTPEPPPSTPPADTTPTPPPPTTTTPPASDPGTGDTTRQPAHPADEFTTSTPGSSPATTPSSSSTSAQPMNQSSSKTGYSDSWLGQDTFTISKTAAKHLNDVTTVVQHKFAGLILLGATTRASRIEAKARRAQETAKVSAFGSGGPPKPGIPLPGQNPFFNLLSGPSGLGVSLMLAGMLAVLGAAFLLPRDRLRAFTTPTVTWRPLAYVPPIELPG